MDFHSIQPLDYGTTPSRCGGGGDQTTMYLLLGGMAVVVYLMMQQQRQQAMMHHPRFLYEQALQAPGALVQGITSMVTQAVHAGKTDTTDASTKIPAIPKDVVEIIDAKPDVTDNIEATRKLSDEEKQANEASLRSWLAKKSNDKACIVLFAHWCPHCKDMIAETVKTAMVHKKVCKFLLVNAESVAPSAFTGDNKIINLQYYPTVLCKTGSTLEQVESPKAVIKKLVEVKEKEATGEPPAKASPPPAEAKEGAQEEVEEANETEDAMLSKFF